MYFTIGGRKTKSGVYRVTYVGSDSASEGVWISPLARKPDARNDPQKIRELQKKMRDANVGEKFNIEKDSSIGARMIRRKLENSHSEPRADSIDDAWMALNNGDRFIRSAARIDLEQIDPKLWRQRALDEKDKARSLSALLALVRVGGIDPFHRKKDDPPVDIFLMTDVLKALQRFQWDSLSEEQRLELLRIYEILFNRFGPPGEAQRKAVLAQLNSHYPAKSRFENAMLCEVLVFLEAPDVVTKTLALIAAAPTQEEQIEYVKSLRVRKTGWTLDQRKEYFTWIRNAGRYSGGMSFGGFLAIMKKDAVATLTPDELTALKPILDAPPETKAVVSQPSRPLVKKWAVADLDKQTAAPLTGRDFDRGRTLFAAGNCFSCHRFANEGGIQGPDITMAAGRFSTRDLLESIIEPSKEISDQYAAVNIMTIDGKMISGRIINLDGNRMMMLPNMLEPNNIVTVDARRIESQEISKVSMMPEGLLDTFREDEILDLLAYILSGGKRDGPMFKK
jgi:putative heme-binding domain-containing protein